jgi:hypothetical protein
MADDKIEGAAELSFAQEVLGLTGDHVKIAGTPGALQKEGTGDCKCGKKPCTCKEVKKEAGLKKLAEMSLREIFEDPNFRRGVMEEIDSSRHIWEPAVENYVRAYHGME